MSPRRTTSGWAVREGCVVHYWVRYHGGERYLSSSGGALWCFAVLWLVLRPLHGLSRIEE